MSSTPRFHPEFGYLCPAPRVRRDLRVASWSALLGTVLGGGAVAVLIAGYDPAGESHGTLPTSPAQAVPLVNAALTNETTLSEVRKTDAPDASTTSTGDGKPALNAAGCTQNRSAFGDDGCLAPKPRRVLLRSGAAGTGDPGVPADLVTSSPVLPDGPSPSAAGDREGSSASPGSPKTPRDKATEDTLSVPVAMPKRPQQTARSQKHRREDGGDQYRGRDERADDNSSYRGSTRVGPLKGPCAATGLWTWSGSW
jgi:hypothetical protein